MFINFCHLHMTTNCPLMTDNYWKWLFVMKYIFPQMFVQNLKDFEIGVFYLTKMFSKQSPKRYDLLTSSPKILACPRSQYWLESCEYPSNCQTTWNSPCSFKLNTRNEDMPPLCWKKMVFYELGVSISHFATLRI